MVFEGIWIIFNGIDMQYVRNIFIVILIMFLLLKFDAMMNDSNNEE
jgi:hypothetical protein